MVDAGFSVLKGGMLTLLLAALSFVVSANGKGDLHSFRTERRTPMERMLVLRWDSIAFHYAVEGVGLVPWQAFLGKQESVIKNIAKG
ncbi:hypothetical protein [Geobacillus genomosp. 3]|nr:hypothetical protein [Geobacillus genomosp. 3]